jgi:hypothetical protein
MQKYVIRYHVHTYAMLGFTYNFVYMEEKKPSVYVSIERNFEGAEGVLTFWKDLSYKIAKLTMGKYKIECKVTRIPDKCKGRIL